MEAAEGVTIDWAPAGTPAVAANCRNCGAAGAKAVVLRARARLPDQAAIDIRMLDCPVCGCAFAEEAPAYNYVGEIRAQTVANYAEAGAGLWPIVRTLAPLGLPSGAAFLEIGCGFGFGLDYAIRARGWRGRGIDPSELAAAGRVLLDLPIESRFFGDREEDVAGPGGGADCILASEVLEHMADPAVFVTTLRRGMASGGVLVLTTPDRAQLHAGAALMEQVPLLSAGAHLVLETAGSLRLLLERCGFAHVEVEANGAQLVAYAATMPIELERDGSVLRGRYRGYLDRRMAEVPAGGMLWWAFAGRAYQEAVADTDNAAAARLWRVIRPVWQQTFGMDPDAPVWPDQVPACIDLDWMASLGPHAMPSLLYARALDRLHGGAALADVERLMRVAAEAATARGVALLQLGAPELANLGVQRATRAALAALAADRASPECLEALGDAVAAHPDARLLLVGRSFVGLVNAGAYGLAEVVRTRWDLGDAPERDVLLCLGIAALQVPGSEDEAVRWLEAAMKASEVGEAAWWSALRGVCVAWDRVGRHAETAALLEGAPGEGMPGDLQERLLF